MEVNKRVASFVRNLDHGYLGSKKLSSVQS